MYLFFWPNDFSERSFSEKMNEINGKWTNEMFMNDEKTKWKKRRRRSSLLTRETPFQFSKWREKSSPICFNFSVLSANPKLNSEPVALKQLKNKPSVQARFTTVPFKSVLEKKRRRYEEEKTTKICSQINMTERRN